MDEKKERERKEKGIHITFHPERLDVELNATISREKAVIFFLLLLAALLVLASALSSDNRQLLLEVLIGALQFWVAPTEKPNAG